MISLSTYWSNFEEARRHLHRAIDQISFGDLEVAVERGVASIEAFIRARAEEWNRNNDQLTDDAKNKVPFNVKIDEWIPKMTGGQKLETGAINFQDFTRLKSMRDDEIVHSNSVSRSQKSSSSRNHKTGTVSNLGGPGRTRTCDLQLGNRCSIRLSYGPNSKSASSGAFAG